MQHQALGAAIFSTDLGRFPPRAPNIFPGRIILRSNPDDDMNQKIAELQKKYPAHCKAIEDPPSNLYDYFDVYDQHLHGQLFLKSVLTEMGIRNKAQRRLREAKVEKIAQDWRSFNHYNFLLFPDFSLDSFTEEDIEEFGPEILVEVAQKLRDQKQILVDEAEHARALQLEIDPVDRATQNASSVCVRVAPLLEEGAYSQLPRNFSAPGSVMVPFRQPPVDQQVPFPAPKLAFDIPPAVPFNVGPMMKSVVSPSLMQPQTQQPGWPRHLHSNSFQSAPKEQYPYSTASYPSRRKVFYGDFADSGVAPYRPYVPDSSVAVLPSDLRGPHMARREAWGPPTFLPPPNQARFQGKRRYSGFKGPTNDARVLEQQDIFQRARGNRPIEHHPAHLRSAQGQPYAQSLETTLQVPGSAIHPPHFVDGRHLPEIQPVREHGESSDPLRQDPSQNPYPHDEILQPINSDYTPPLSEHPAQSGLSRTAPVTPKRSRQGTKTSPDKASKVKHSSPRQRHDPSNQSFDSTSPDRKVWIGALRQNADVQLLQQVLSDVGRLESAPEKIHFSRINGLSSPFPGFAFATYERPEDAAAAVGTLHEKFSKILDCRMLVRPARPRGWSDNSPPKQTQSARRDKRDSSATFESAAGGYSYQTNSPTARRGARSDCTVPEYSNKELAPEDRSHFSASKNQSSDTNAKFLQTKPEPSESPLNRAQNPEQWKTPESARQKTPSSSARQDQGQKKSGSMSSKRPDPKFNAKNCHSGPTIPKSRSTTPSPMEHTLQKDANLAGMASPESSLASTAVAIKSASPVKIGQAMKKKGTFVSKEEKTERAACDPFVQEVKPNARTCEITKNDPSGNKKQPASSEKGKLKSTETKPPILKENTKGHSVVPKVPSKHESRVNGLSSDGPGLGSAPIVAPTSATSHVQSPQSKTRENRDTSPCEISNKEGFICNRQEKSVASSEAQTVQVQKEPMADDLATPKASVKTSKAQLGKQNPASLDASRKTSQGVVATANEPGAASASNQSSKVQVEKKPAGSASLHKASHGKQSGPHKSINVLVATPTVMIPIKRVSQPKAVKSSAVGPPSIESTLVEQQTPPRAVDGHLSSPDLINTPSSSISPALSAYDNGETRDIDAPTPNIINSSHDAPVNMPRSDKEAEAYTRDSPYRLADFDGHQAASFSDSHVPDGDQATELLKKCGSEERGAESDKPALDADTHQPVIQQKKKRSKGKKKSKTPKALKDSLTNEPKATDADSRPPSALPKPEMPFLSDENEPLPLPVVLRPQDNMKLPAKWPPRIYSSWAEKAGGFPGKPGETSALIEIMVNGTSTYRSAERSPAVFSFSKASDDDAEKAVLANRDNDENRKGGSAGFCGHLRGGDLIVVDKTDESENHSGTAEVDDYLRKAGKASRQQLLEVINQIEPQSYVQYDGISEPSDVQRSSRCATTPETPESPENKQALSNTVDAPELLKALGLHVLDQMVEQDELKKSNVSDDPDTSNIRFIEDNSMNKVDLLSAWPARAEPKSEPVTSSRPLLAHHYSLEDGCAVIPARLVVETHAHSGLSNPRNKETAKEVRASSDAAPNFTSFLDRSYSRVTATPLLESLKPGDIVEIMDKANGGGRDGDETVNESVKNAQGHADPWSIPETEPSWGTPEVSGAEPCGELSGPTQDASGHSSKSNGSSPTES